jgi:hypothetical protein
MNDWCFGFGFWVLGFGFWFLEMVWSFFFYFPEWDELEFKKVD